MKLLLILNFLFNQIVVNDVPNYSENVVDLSTYNIATLYKGSSKQFIAEKLNAKDISDIASKERGLWYLTLDFTISKETINGNDIWLQFRTNINAASIYLNNKLLFKNGIIKNEAEADIGGKNLVLEKIPKEFILEGHNKITIAFTNYKNRTNTIFRDVSIGKLEDFQKHIQVMTTAPILCFGIFMFLLLINIVLYFSLEKKRVFLLLATLFLVNSLLVAYEILYWNGFVPSASLIHSYMLRSGLEYITYFVLLFILYYEYAYEKKVLYISILAFVLTYIVSILTNSNTAVSLSLIPFGVSIFALLKGIKNSRIITISLFILFTLNYLDDNNLIESYEFVHSNFIITSLIYKLDNLGMISFAMVMIYISAEGILSKTKALNEAKLKLAQLEYQFLQKRILPHFVVNSLMSLQQLLSREPKTASKMVEALSEEFHLLSEMSTKKLVPIYQEIGICEAHLRIMSIQQNANYRMYVKGILGDEMIPPIIIHTLVENGITHGYSGKQDANFELSKQETPNSVVYRLFNDSKEKMEDFTLTSGTGLKYIEARLEACYPKKWKLYSNKVENGWESIIEIKHTL
ncbi:histidine kinase [uncultured Tenacibaculum sp.]|uniref:histidine kinase n=1 Tax=uncultured Tenacibaculum sp. TaxID=174713 RepID=UPI002628220C|nr:histidine kinase [uncultured Tenacibaculum sp.]